MAGFRKTGAFQGNYELVVYLANITNFLAMAPGTGMTITNFTPTQLADAFPDGNADLQWSAFASFIGSKPWTNALGIFPKATCWYTIPRTNPAIQSAPPIRFSVASQPTLSGAILGVGNGANSISSYLAVTNTDNNSVLVREPIGSYEQGYLLTDHIGDPTDPSFGDFGGKTLNFSVENLTPDPFTSAAVSDLYQSCPASFLDPISGQTNGNAYWVGYFTLNTDGTMTFTRASAGVALPPPPPQIVAVTRSAGVSSVSFTTTNGATYTLYFTNSSGLGAPVHTWPSLPNTVSGNGGTQSIMDTSSDPNRFYEVGAH